MSAFLTRIPALFSITMALCLWYLCLTHAPVLLDPDTAWHLAAGDLWREHGMITTDPWAWTSEGKPWINWSWAFDIAISWLKAHTGFVLLYPLCLIIVSTLIGWQTLRAYSQGALLSVLFLTVPLLVQLVYAGALLRPNLITLIFTIISYHLLVTDNPVWKRRRWFLLPIITILWVNMHGGFLYLFLLCGVFGLEALIRNNWEDAKRLTLLGALCALCTGANPFGYEILTSSYAGMSTPFNVIINEWKPTNFRENARMLILLVLLLIGGGFTDKRIRIADRLLIFVLFYLTLTSLRHSVMLALFCIPYLGLTLTNVIRDMPQLRWIEDAFARHTTKVKQQDLRIIGSMMLAFVVLFIFSPWPRDQLLGKSPDISSEMTAPEDITYLREHFADKKIFNHYDLGGHLIYYGRGEPKLFVDGRSNTAYPEQVLTDYRDFMRYAGQDDKGRAIHKKYGFEAVLIPNNIEEKSAWDDNYFWERAYEGSSFSVYWPRK